MGLKVNTPVACGWQDSGFLQGPPTAMSLSSASPAQSFVVWEVPAGGRAASSSGQSICSLPRAQGSTTGKSHGPCLLPHLQWLGVHGLRTFRRVFTVHMLDSACKTQGKTHSSHSASAWPKAAKQSERIMATFMECETMQIWVSRSWFCCF